jgi:hypothetical protein
MIYETLLDVFSLSQKGAFSRHKSYLPFKIRQQLIKFSFRQVQIFIVP